MSWESDIFICSYCGKRFPKTPTKLAIHIRNKHDTVRKSIANTS